MSSSFSSWYNSHYATWNRTRSIQQPPFLARTDTNIARAAVAMHNGTHPGDGASNAKDKKTQDSLFGPNIGVVSSGPAWSAATEKKVLTDELTPEIVESWIEKSKDASQPTTTLQALVNLKRPTLRLSPLSAEDPANTAPDPHLHHHGLEFEYDCDAPKCGIYVHILLPKDHPDAPVTAASSGLSKLLVFETVVEGGFGKLLKLEEGALLELGRFEYTPAPAAGAPTNPSSTSLINQGDAIGEPSSTGDASAAATDAGAARNPRRRFTHFHFRKRSQGRSVSGPALAVVDAEPVPATDSKGKEDTSEGVRVMIRLAALDEQGTELASLNEQVTYLHIVRFGTRTDTEAEDEDTRPWVVKVVKREATIGPHTFHLHEIYGLTSSSVHTTHTPAPTAPLPSSPTSETHTYPPVTPTLPATTVSEDDPSTECLLCLSSPREVVLLPCRHLVACKDCALNMVEFGAGGNITQSEEPVAAGGDTGEAGAAEGTDGTPGDATTPAPAPTPPAAPTPNTRRKRKAKGWFCPVCRQPYTSLLRITTHPPPAEGEGDTETPSATTEGGETPGAANGTTETRSGGLLGGIGPSFFRGLSFNRNPQADVESQAGVTRPGT
ncbi:hypothetical protein Hypma_002293 [Hypsizygus marmoreus]|uniref:RING-type domain-containing protein n=1 Tax=Hypsizygus marmoreus TaxID=39966 RepID=A0A369K302_HYPMA|nr:hypothetical protein Hypma_002293 [Hypsizygus marmoreus]